MIRALNHASSRLATRLRGNVAIAAAARSEPPPPHKLTFYEYEASPWCRLVREYATILDLQMHIRPCPRQTLFLEGAYDASSRFRPEAMSLLKEHHQTDDLTFPLLVDHTDESKDPVVLTQSYSILEHLWGHYGQSVLPDQKRPDQQWNSSRIPFPLRFLSLVAPSYLRPLPTCGIFQTKSVPLDQIQHSNKQLVLYQMEGCPESRVVREVLCALELPYMSVPAGQGCSSPLKRIPTLLDVDSVRKGADECTAYLWNKYRDPNAELPLWWNQLTSSNLGRSGAFGVVAYTAFVKGRRAFVPPSAFK